MKHLLNTGIYEIKHIASNKRYVGSAAVLTVRLKSHINNLNKGKHHNRYLQFAWNKYGESSFEIKVILICSKKNLIFYEQRAIDAYQGNLYNLTPTAGSQIGWKPTAETRRKISEAKKGVSIQVPPFTDEHRRRLSISNSGRKASEETRRKMSEAHKGLGVGKTVSEEVRSKISETKKGSIPWNKGKTGIYSKEILSRMSRQGTSHSEDAKRKMSESRKGRVAWNKGKTGIFSKETLMKISQSSTGRKHSQEARQKISKAMQAYHAKARAGRNTHKAQNEVTNHA